MARKAEVGIEYFPVNTDIVHNQKVKLVVAEFGSKTTWAVLLPLYCKIYREKGYWIDWLNEDAKLLFAQDECKLEKSVVDEVVKGCIKRSLFDKGVFDAFGVLTSDRIQENYFEATARRKSVEFISEFLIENNNVNINRENVCIIDLDVNIITKKVDINPQKKKENKKEKERENESGFTTEQKDLFKRFTDWITANAPRVQKMKKPITIDEFLKLDKDINREVLKKVCVSMENYADLHKKYISANLTILNWAKREQSTISPSDNQPSVNGALSRM